MNFLVVLASCFWVIYRENTVSYAETAKNKFSKHRYKLAMVNGDAYMYLDSENIALIDKRHMTTATATTTSSMIG